MPSSNPVIDHTSKIETVCGGYLTRAPWLDTGASMRVGLATVNFSARTITAVRRHAVLEDVSLFV